MHKIGLTVIGIGLGCVLMIDGIGHAAPVRTARQQPTAEVTGASVKQVTAKIVINRPTGGPTREKELFKPFGHPHKMVPGCPHFWCGGARYTHTDVVIIPAKGASFVSGEADYHCGPNDYLYIVRFRNGHPTVADTKSTDQGTCTWYHIVVRYDK